MLSGNQVLKCATGGLSTSGRALTRIIPPVVVPRADAIHWWSSRWTLRLTTEGPPVAQNRDLRIHFTTLLRTSLHSSRNLPIQEVVPP